jgi:hypothetical protein
MWALVVLQCFTCNNYYDKNFKKKFNIAPYMVNLMEDNFDVIFKLLMFAFNIFIKMWVLDFFFNPKEI